MKQIAADMLAQPGASIPKASDGWAGAKAAFRLFDNAACDPAEVLAAQRAATLGHARGQPVLLAAQDTTTLIFSTHRHTRGLGPIGNNADKTIGLPLHTTLLLRENGARWACSTRWCWRAIRRSSRGGQRRAQPLAGAAKGEQ